MKPKPILIVQGAQFGSESKGMVAAALCERRKVDYAVRTGAVNAGHSVYYKGRKYVNQQLPTGWVNEDTRLVIGPGAYINPYVLLSEIKTLAEAKVFAKGPRIYIDERAGLHLPEHTERASLSGRHYSIGATGKGCSEAIIDRIRLRGKGGQLFRQWFADNSQTGTDIEWMSGGFFFTDTAKLLNDAYDRGDQILLEGTQGTLLDLYLGPYPYTTHKQCTAAQWVVEAGLSPSLDYEIVLVARTHPIRVAGNSGPMPQEIDWPTLATEINVKLHKAGKGPLIDDAHIHLFEMAKGNFPKSRYKDRNTWLSESDRDAWNQCTAATREELAKLFEFTTVTKKLRRVARLDIDSLKYSVMVNRPSSLVVTFANYEFPELWGATAVEHRPLYDYLRGIEQATGVPVRAFTTGPESKHFLERGVASLSSSMNA